VAIDLSTGRLPPGQTPTRRFPVVGESAPREAALDLSAWRLQVSGLVPNQLSLTYDNVRALGHDDVTVDLHCVTGWTRFASAFTGLPLRAVVDLAGGPAPEARFVRFEAYSSRNHDTTLPLELALAECWLVHAVDGEPLDVAHGWPLRLLAPSRYFSKSVKWLHTIELLAEDRPGYWERQSSYHNNADPWPGDQRFSSGSLRPEQADTFRRATGFDKYRGRVLIGLDLSGWRPRSADLRGLQLKGCDLRRAGLAGRDLRQANLSLSDLRGADLRGVNLSGADIEGADFTGADLRGADLRGAACSATKVVGARVEGVRWAGALGLLEDQEAWLMTRAVGSAG
jgi:DMSO/TMAO reductase YedYZ molybdopterin-dependent catalytic subunit